MNLGYFKNRDIVITLICSIATGIIMMSNIFLPQFCENSMMMRSGSGGYFVIILGIFAGVGSPMSGKLIDKFGVKPVLGFGFATAVVGSLVRDVRRLPEPQHPHRHREFGAHRLGHGLHHGNAAQLHDAAENRRRGIELRARHALACALHRNGDRPPAIMVAFVANAGVGMQTAITDALPKDVTVSHPCPMRSRSTTSSETMKDDASFAKNTRRRKHPPSSLITSISKST